MAVIWIFGTRYSSFHVRCIEVLFTISAILWIGSIAWLVFDITSKKKKLYFSDKGSLFWYCFLSIVVGLVLWYIFSGLLVDPSINFRIL